MKLSLGIPDLFKVGEVAGDGPRRFYVYPYTVPPDEADMARARLMSRVGAQVHADQLNVAARKYAGYLLTSTLGAVTQELTAWGSLLGSPESREAEQHLIRLGRLLLESPDAVAACAFFQARLIQEHMRGMEQAHMDIWLATLRPEPCMN